jgi:hypothetical protein
MKKIFLVLSGILLGAGYLSAQIVDDEIDRPTLQRVQAQRVAFITERLGLTPQESEKFWSLENEFEQAQESVRQKHKAERDPESMSDAEADRFIQSRFQMEEELLQLKKDYYQRFKAVISPRKIALYQKADREFKRYILEEIRKRRLQRSGGGFRRN